MEEIVKKVRAAVEAVFDVKVEPEVGLAPEGSGADYATNVALKLAGRLHQAPMEIAEKLREELGDCGFTVEVAAPGFLNFISPDEYFIKNIERVNRGEVFAELAKNISPDEYLNKTVIAEFSDPNPFKVLHVGHLYTSIVGDCLARLMEVAGANVVRANFGGDVGMHVAKNMYEILQRRGEMGELMGGVDGTADDLANGSSASGENGSVNDEGVGTKTAALELGQKRAEFMAKCYVDGTRAYEGDEATRERIVQLNKKIYAIAMAGKDGELDDEKFVISEDVAPTTREIARVYWRCREWSYDYFKDFYARIGVKFDKYYPESTVAERGLAAVKKELAAGVYEESDGAVVFKGEKYGLHTRVFINREGLPTYEAKDVGLILTKWADYHFDKSVIITGNDIKDYMKVVLASVGEFEPELPPRTLHLTHGNVKLAGGVKMSSRKGNFLKAVEVLDLASEALREGYDSNDERVMLAAVKYAFLKSKVGVDTIFDLKESVSMTGNSGPYLQYAVVRGKKILGGDSLLQSDSADGAGNTFSSGHASPQPAVAGAACSFSVVPSERPLRKSISSSSNWKLNPYERKLAKLVGAYEKRLREVVVELAPQKLCGYLYELAQEFSRFYENVKVAGSEFEAERRELVAAYVAVMEHGLGLLGIEVPEEM